MKKFLEDWKWGILAGSAIFILALMLRLVNLTILPIFADEAIYIRWAQVMRAEPTLRFLPLSDGKQPLFMWLVIPFLKLFGDPLFAGRATSVVAGIGTFVGIFVLTDYFFKSQKTALIAAFIYAISPFSVFFDRMALTDSLLTMFGVWVLFFGLLAAKNLRLDFAMLAGFALGGALLTKSPALFFVILLPSTWILSRWPDNTKTKILHLIKLAFLLLVAYAIAYGMYNILRLGPNFQMIGARNRDYVFPLSHLWTNPRDPFVFLIDRSFEWLRMMGPWTIIVFWLISYLVTWRRYKKEVLILTVWFLVPILIQSEFAKVFTARYILFSLPYLFILAASVFLTRMILVRRILTVGLIIFIFQAAIFDYLLLTNPESANLPRSERSGYLEEWTAGHGIRQVANYLKTQTKELSADRRIVVGTEGFFGTLPDGLQIYFDNDPHVIIKGVGITVDRVDASLVESAKSGNKTYLVVNSSRFKIKNPEEFGLTLIASYPKAKRPDGYKEYVQFGPRDSLYLFEVLEKPT